MTWEPGYPPCERCQHDFHGLACSGATYHTGGVVVTAPCDCPAPTFDHEASVPR